MIREDVDAPVIQELAEQVDVATELDAVSSVVPGKGERVHADARLPEHPAGRRPAMADEQVSRSAIGTALEAQVVDLEARRGGAEREPPVGVAAFLVDGKVRADPGERRAVWIVAPAEVQRIRPLVIPSRLFLGEP